MFIKLRNPVSLEFALTTTCPLFPTCVVCTSKSVLIGGRDTDRTACAQNLAYIGLPTHAGAQRLVASDVNAMHRPSPVCQWASSGSVLILLFAPTFAATSASLI